LSITRIAAFLPYGKNMGFKENLKAELTYAGMRGTEYRAGTETEKRPRKRKYVNKYKCSLKTFVLRLKFMLRLPRALALQAVNPLGDF
jgi:hypothetical protein